MARGLSTDSSQMKGSSGVEAGAGWAWAVVASATAAANATRTERKTISQRKHIPTASLGLVPRAHTLERPQADRDDRRFWVLGTRPRTTEYMVESGLAE